MCESKGWHFCGNVMPLEEEWKRPLNDSFAKENQYIK
jgi:hypothetical protein